MKPTQPTHGIHGGNAVRWGGASATLKPKLKICITIAALFQLTALLVGLGFAPTTSAKTKAEQLAGQDAATTAKLVKCYARRLKLTPTIAESDMVKSCQAYISGYTGGTLPGIVLGQIMKQYSVEEQIQRTRGALSALKP